MNIKRICISVLFVARIELLGLLLGASPAQPLWGQSFNGEITFQELLPYTGSGYPAGQNRTAYPASVAFPLAAGDAPAGWWTGDLPSGSNQLGLTTASVGQFRCLSWHKDGSCKNVLVDTEVSNNFASTPRYTGLSLTLSGAGNFGGSSLAVDNAKLVTDGSACEAAGTSSGYICVDTGTIRAQVKKAGFNGFDKVVSADGTVLVSTGSDGLTVSGPDTTQAMPSTPSVPTAQAVSGGSYTASASLYAKAACVGASGESLASAVTTSVSVGSGQLLQVSNPCSGGYFNVYAGTGTGQGAMHLQNIQPVNTASWTEPTACPFAGQGCVTGRGITNYLRGSLTYAGNSDGCGTSCTTAYKTSLDTGSTATIEENGPVKAVIRIKAANTNGSVTFLKEDTRLVFYRNQSAVRQPVLLKNADDPCPSAVSATDTCYNTTHFASDAKGFSAHEMRLTPGFTVTGFTSATDSTPLSVTLDGAHDAYLYQAYSSLHQLPESDATAYCTAISTSCAFPEILRYTSTGGTNAYAQAGYKIVANNTTQATNTSGGGAGMGWVDFTGSAGQGIQVGFWSMATEWPKAVQAKWLTDHYEIRAGILPDQALFDAATAQPYYISWPQYRIADIIYNFHGAALADAAGDFLKAQYYLVGRASVDAYNRAQAFGKVYPLLDPVAADNYMKGISAYCSGTAGTCVPDYVAKARRVYSWPQAAEGNQNDWDWEFVQQFLERGLTGRLLYALYDARFFLTQELPRADGFKWRDRPVGTLTSFGFPNTPGSGGKYLTGNGGLAVRNWNTDPSHSHFYGGPQFTYAFTGDSFLKDALDQAWGDYTLNPNIVQIAQGGNSGQGLGQARGVGQQVTHRAHYYDYALSQKNSADAATALSIASTILHTQMPLTLQARGFGSNVKGVSPSTGFPQLAEADVTPDSTDGIKATANISSISCDAGGTTATVTLASALPFDSPNTWAAPEVVRVAGVPSGNFNGDVTLATAASDRLSMTYPAGCTPSASCTGAGSCGTMNVPGKCPRDTNGDCSGARYTDTFMGPLIAEGLVELAASTESATTDPNAVWADHNLAFDTALGILKQQIYEVMLPAGGKSLYYSYLDYYNGDKHYAMHPAWANVGYSNYGLLWSLTGTVAPAEKAAFESYLAGKWATGTSWEYGSNVAETGIAHMTGFPNAAWSPLVDAAHTDTCVASDGDLGAPHCHLMVTVPAGAGRWRIKANGAGKSIVDWLNFDSRTDPGSDGSGCTAVGKYWSGATGDRSGCYGFNPAQNWPFFSSTEVTSLPLPSGATQDIVVSASNFSGFNTSDLGQNKFAVKAEGGEVEPPPAAATGTTIQGGVLKGGVVR